MSLLQQRLLYVHVHLDSGSILEIRMFEACMFKNAGSTGFLQI